MRNAVEDTVKNNNSNRDITAAFDGSWQKRGHTSLNGVVSVTCLETGKVLDFECLSKYCFKCKNRSNKDHTFEKNFEGFCGRMESDDILKIFQRSERLSNVSLFLLKVHKNIQELSKLMPRCYAMLLW
ncbi:uncharacterized protein NPIL_140901 [Nephila pilipes]|uniref:Mutator-like transposase domain-containing protein n=1 Tax=Nephila pilipes TaxID=299642 RepID=A0A8X6T860_NEPPI|nr:uncharacterized protein NPIL_140901 [Nephila pilipes]